MFLRSCVHAFTYVVVLNLDIGSSYGLCRSVHCTVYYCTASFQPLWLHFT